MLFLFGLALRHHSTNSTEIGRFNASWNPDKSNPLIGYWQRIGGRL
jgi:hypothetical protein